MPAGQHRKPPKFLRSGRHVAPSPATAVMQKAGMTVPTVVMASVLTVSAQPPRPDGASPGLARPVVLERLDDGTYGVCEGEDEEGNPCDEKIPVARLNALSASAG